MKSDRVVSTEDGMRIAKKFGMEFMECSAKEGLNVSSAFETIGHMIVDSLEEKEKKSTTSTVNLSDGNSGSSSSSSSSGGCC